MSSSSVGIESERGGSSSRGKPQSKTAALFLLFGIDVVFRKLFQRFQISFPSSLAGCGFLLTVLLMTTPKQQQDGSNSNSSSSSSESHVYDVIVPGAEILKRFLPLFFTPTLVALPLSKGIRSIGSVAEYIKVAVVTIVGFFFSLLTTAGTVNSISGKKKSGEDDDESSSVLTTRTTGDKKPLAPVQFMCLDLPLDCLSLYVARYYVPQPVFHIWEKVYYYGKSLGMYNAAKRNVLVFAVSMWLQLYIHGRLLYKLPFASMLTKYQNQIGKVFLYMLGPSVVSFACDIYRRRKLVLENALSVVTGIAVSSFGGLFGTAALVRILNIANPAIRLSLLSRNITSPLAMAIANMLGGADVPFAVTVVVLTGVLGASIGASVMSKLGIRNPAARGMGIGAAAHGLGTAAFKNEETAFPFGAISMALTACASTVLVSIPPIRQALITLALGGAGAV